MWLIGEWSEVSLPMTLYTALVWGELSGYHMFIVIISSAFLPSDDDVITTSLRLTYHWTRFIFLTLFLSFLRVIFQGDFLKVQWIEITPVNGTYRTTSGPTSSTLRGTRASSTSCRRVSLGAYSTLRSALVTCSRTTSTSASSSTSWTVHRRM